MNNIIGIIAAMEAEIQSIKYNMTNKSTETYSGIEFVKGELCGKNVVVAQCGIGKAFACICAQTMALIYKPDLIINSGVAGTLSDKLSVGDIAVSTSVVHHDLDTSPLGDPLGMVSGINIINFPADENAVNLICKTAKELNINCLKGTIASGDQFISSKERKEFIKNTFGAIACEMEGASIGHVCYVNKIPFVVIRAISDSADNSSNMDYSEFLELAAERSFEVVTAFIEVY